MSKLMSILLHTTVVTSGPWSYIHDTVTVTVMTVTCKCVSAVFISGCTIFADAAACTAIGQVVR